MKQIISFITTICCISLVSGCTDFDFESIQTQKPCIEYISAEIDLINTEYVSVRLDIELNIVTDYCKVEIYTPSKTHKDWFDHNNSVYCTLPHSDFSNKTKSVELEVAILDKDNRELDSDTVLVSYPYIN